jgi:hypothetical protein
VAAARHQLDPVVESGEDPAVEAEEDPAVEAEEDPGVESEEDPAVESEEDPAVVLRPPSVVATRHLLLRPPFVAEASGGSTTRAQRGLCSLWSWNLWEPNS